jgi:hypothetical protein
MSDPLKVAIETMHVIPLGDLREHEPSPNCWCKPIQDEECSQLYVHNSMDRREEYESGRKPT